MIGHLVGVTLEHMRHIHSIFMGVAVIFNFCVMFGNNLADLGKFMRRALHSG